MHIMVFVKAILDPEAPVGALSFEGDQVRSESVRHVLGPFEANALELAMKLKEATGAECTAVALGGAEQETALRTALAVGATRALRLDAPQRFRDPLETAMLLAMAAKEQPADLYCFGRQAGDWDEGVVAGCFAGLLGDLPFLPLVQVVRPEGEDWLLEREVPGGRALDRLPRHHRLVLSVTNHPFTTLRLPKVRDVLQANRRPIEVLPTEEPPTGPRLTLRRLVARPVERRGERLEGSLEALAEALADRLVAFCR